MGKRQKRAPNRTATRSSAPLRVVRDDVELVEYSSGETSVDDLEGLAGVDEMVGEIVLATLKSLRAARHRITAEESLRALFEVLAEGALGIRKMSLSSATRWASPRLM